MWAAAAARKSSSAATARAKAASKWGRAAGASPPERSSRPRSRSSGSRRPAPKVGDRGLPRRPLRRPARPHPRDHRHLPHGVGPRGEARPPGPLLHDAAARGAGHRPRQAAQDHQQAAARPASRSTSRRSARRTSRSTAELAEGWLPLFFMPDKAKEVFGPALDEGFAKRDPSLGELDIVAGGLLAVGDDVKGVLDMMRPMVALYVGGMGARGKNFYNALVQRYGFEAEAERDPGPVPRRQEGRGRRRGARRAARRLQPRGQRDRGQGEDRRVPRGRRDHAQRDAHRVAGRPAQAASSSSRPGRRATVRHPDL